MVNATRAIHAPMHSLNLGDAVIAFIEANCRVPEGALSPAEGDVHTAAVCVTDLRRALAERRYRAVRFVR